MVLVGEELYGTFLGGPLFSTQIFNRSDACIFRNFVGGFEPRAAETQPNQDQGV